MGRSHALLLAERGAKVVVNDPGRSRNPGNEGGFAADGTPNGEGAWHFGAGHTVVGEFASSVKPRHGELTKAETASVVAGTFTDETTSLTWKTAGVVEGA